MKILCQTGLEIVRERGQYADPRHELARVKKHTEDLAKMMEQALQHLKDPTACQSMRDQLEHWNLYLHRSYILSELYRSALKRKQASSELSSLRAVCLEHMANTVDAFLGLQNVTRFATQSWAAIHRSLSSALLLAILKQPLANHRVRILLDRLIAVISNVNSPLDPAEASAPISRAVQALSRLCPYQGSEGSLEYGSSELQSSVWEPSNSSDTFLFGNPSSEGAMEDSDHSEDSPYRMMAKILWGSQAITPP